MATISAFACDGPGCTELAARQPGVRHPAGWIRVAVHDQLNDKHTAVVCTWSCAQAWLTGLGSD